MNSKEKWNEKYIYRIDENKISKKNEKLARFRPYFSGGKAIDFACGLGGNSVFLAEEGFHVTAIDISDVAINYVREQAKLRNLQIEAIVADLTNFQTIPVAENSFDLTIITYFLDRYLFPFVQTLVKENGFIFIETFYESSHVSEKNEHVSKRYKLRSNELIKTFYDWQILYFEENEQEGIQTLFARKS